MSLDRVARVLKNQPVYVQVCSLKFLIHEFIATGIRMNSIVTERVRVVIDENSICIKNGNVYFVRKIIEFISPDNVKLFAVRQQFGEAAFGFRHQFVTQPDIGEGPAHHHFVITAP